MSTDLIHKESQRRLLALDQCLRLRSKGMTRPQILTKLRAQGFTVSLRTFNRDIRLLRDLNAPVANEYRQAADGSWPVYWFYRDPSWTLSKIHMTDGALFSLLVAQRVMEQFAGLPVANDLRQAFEEITKALNRKVSIRHDTLLPISFSPETAAPVDPAIWAEVARATLQHRYLSLTYRKGWGNERGALSVRTVEPYHIINLQGTWYLLGTASYGNKDLRQFALTRITRAKALTRTFRMPAEFDIDEILKVTFGQFIGNPEDAVEIRVRFNKRIAPLVNARRFSARETRKVLPDGDVEVSFLASQAGPWPLYHIKSWVLSWGSDAEVVAPESLRALVRDEIRVLAARESKTRSA